MKNNLADPIHPKYRADIDGLRAIAVLSVVGFHAFPARLVGGFIGVDIFFVISGFLISTIIFSNLERGYFNFIDFYSRRIKRIFPSLLVVLLSCLLFGWFVLLADEYQQLGKHTAAGAGFISNLVFWNESGYFDSDSDTKPLLHLWSLGIEEQFYLIWPLVLFICWKARQRLLLVTIVLLLVSFGLSIQYIHTDAVAAFYAPQARFWELLSGSILAWWVLHTNQQAQHLSPASKNLLSMAGISLIIAGLTLTTKNVAFPGWWALLPVAGAVMVISAGTGAGKAAGAGAGTQAWLNRKVLSHPVLVWFGLISFPLYLWHWPILSFIHILENDSPGRVMRLLAVMASVFLAWLTYQLVEKPLRFGKRSSTIVSVLAILMAAVGAIGYYIYQYNGLQFRPVVLQNFDARQIVKFESNPAEPCEATESFPAVRPFCTSYPAAQSRRKIVLWGDSSIVAWSPVFKDIAAREHDSLITLSHLSCPPIVDARKTHFEFEGSRQYCADGTLQRQVIEYIQAIKPDLIVVIASWNSYSSYSNREFIKGNVEGAANAATTKQMISVKLPETLDLLSKISKTIVFKNWPILPANPGNRIVSFLPNDKNEIHLDHNEFIRDSKEVNNIFKMIGNNQILIFDPAEKICTSGVCTSTFRSIKMYADRYHITPQGAMMFKPDLASLISSF